LYLNERSSSEHQQTLKVTQREISQLVGVSRESANKQLRKWQRQKWVRLERGGLSILSPDALKRLVSENTE
jgi:CRP-like cAMP-binding protein